MSQASPSLEHAKDSLGPVANADVGPTPGRSRNMAAIRSRDTQPERRLRDALRKARLLGYRCHAALPGKPDVAFTRWKVAIFVDGAFWHGHPEHFSFGKLEPYWDEKIRRTQRRDREANEKLQEAGYAVIRFWDFEVLDDPTACARQIEALLTLKGRQRTT